jgi:hypothetical protein
MPCFPGFSEDASATLALDKGISFFHSHERNKKKRDIVVDSLESSLVKAARRAPHAIAIEVYCSRLNPTYQKKHTLSTLVAVNTIGTGIDKRNEYKHIKNLVIHATSPDLSPSSDCFVIATRGHLAVTLWHSLHGNGLSDMLPAPLEKRGKKTEHAPSPREGMARILPGPYPKVSGFPYACQ